MHEPEDLKERIELEAIASSSLYSTQKGYAAWLKRNRKRAAQAELFGDLEQSLPLEPDPKVPRPGQPVVLSTTPVESKRRTVCVVPGTRLAEIARFLLTKNSYRRYVAPAIADMQHEYVEAVAEGRELHARWIAMRGYFLVIPGWCYGLMTQAIERIFTA